MRKHLVLFILSLVVSSVSAQQPYDSSRDSLFVFGWETNRTEVDDALDRANCRAATSVELRHLKFGQLDKLRPMMSSTSMHSTGVGWITIVALGADKRYATVLRYDPDQKDTFQLADIDIDPNTVWPAGTKFLAKRK